MDTDEQTDEKNAAQLQCALDDTKKIWGMLDGKGLSLEELGELPDPRPE